MPRASQKCGKSTSPIYIHVRRPIPCISPHWEVSGPMTRVVCISQTASYTCQVCPVPFPLQTPIQALRRKDLEFFLRRGDPRRGAVGSPTSNRIIHPRIQPDQPLYCHFPLHVRDGGSRHRSDFSRLPPPRIWAVVPLVPLRSRASAFLQPYRERALGVRCCAHTSTIRSHSVDIPC